MFVYELLICYLYRLLLQADTNNHLIRRIVISSGAVSIVAGTPGATGSTNGLGTVALFYHPFGVTMDASANFAIVVSESGLAYFCTTLLWSNACLG